MIVVSVEPSLQTNWQVYPIPADEVLHFSLGQLVTDGLTYQLIDLHGKTVLFDQLKSLEAGQEVEIDLTGNAKGIYFLKISSPSFNGIKKVIIR